MNRKNTLLTFLLISILSFGQNQIVNIDFENWDDLGSSDEEPVGWSSFRHADGSLANFVNGNQKVERNSDTRPGSSGNYSAKIWSTSVFGTVANGTMTTGQIQANSTTASSDDNHNKTIRANADFNQSFTGMPDSLAVWIKTNMSSSSSQARISATIHDDYDYRDPDGSDANAPSHAVAKAQLNFSTAGQWQRISIPFDYSFPSNTPEYILITITTNANAGGGSANDEVFIDDLQFIYPPEATIAPSTTQDLVENQVGTALTVSESPSAASTREWKFSTSSGGGYQSFTSPESGTSYTPQFSTAGTYYVVCESTIGGAIVTSNQVQINVASFSNSIAPTVAQVVFQNQAGNTLTVNETPNADSREWKFSTTSGSGYQSFASAETGMSYSPLFLNTGVYYVICESTLAGQVIISNEVMVTVNVSSTPSVSITPSSAQVLEVDQDGTTLTANETITPSAREWKYSTTSGNGYQSFVSAEVDNTYTPNFSTAGTFYIVCFSTMSGTEYTSNEVMITVNDLGISISPTNAILLYENLPGDTLYAVETQAATSREWKVSTTQGGPYTSFTTVQTNDFYIPLFSNAGTYFLICEADFDGIVKTSNEVGIVVNNGPNITISPSSSQEILIDEAGTALNANTGSFSPSAIEWKFSTTSGNAYQSFAAAETNTTYTPMFDATGEYFIICEAIFSGQTLRSNEVRIDVIEMVGIIEYNTPTFDVYMTNQNLIVNLNELSLNQAKIEVLSMDGKIIATELLEDFTKNKINLTASQGVYIFNICTSDKNYQGKFIIK